MGQYTAIFCPIDGGRICIFDPSGVYVTRNDGIAGPKIAAAELGAYYNYWFLNKMTITNFTFYNIDTINGSYTQVFTRIASTNYRFLLQLKLLIHKLIFI